MGGRSMELSEVVRFGNQTLAFCDKTGLVFEVTDTDAYGRLILMDGAIPTR